MLTRRLTGDVKEWRKQSIQTKVHWRVSDNGLVRFLFRPAMIIFYSLFVYLNYKTDFYFISYFLLHFPSRTPQLLFIHSSLSCTVYNLSVCLFSFLSSSV